MCIFHIDECFGNDAERLHDILSNPSSLVISAGLRRCKWHEALASSRSFGAALGQRSMVKNSLCPYTVMRHDATYIADDELQTLVDAVLMDCVLDHGCRKCWATIRDRDWIGELPSSADKKRILNNTASWSEGEQRRSGSEAGYRARGMKRGAEDFGCVNSDSDVEIVRGNKRVRLESPSSSQSPSSESDLSSLEHAESAILTEIPPPPWAKGKGKSTKSASFLPSSPMISSGRTNTTSRAGDRASSADDSDEDPHAKRRAQFELAWAKKLSLEEFQASRRENHEDKLPRGTSPVPSNRSLESETAEEQVGTDSDQLASVQEAVADSWQKLFAAAERAASTMMPDDNDDEVENDEVLHAVQDGSFKRAVADFSRRGLGERSKKDQRIVAGRVAEGDDDGFTTSPPPSQENQTEEIARHRDTTRRLRAEKAHLADRVEALLRESAAARLREAELMRRIRELEENLSVEHQDPMATAGAGKGMGGKKGKERANEECKKADEDEDEFQEASNGNGRAPLTPEDSSSDCT